MVVRPCPKKLSCVGGKVSEQCAFGHAGSYCDVCEVDFHRSSEASPCAPCEGSSLLTYIKTGSFGAVAVLVLIVICVRRQQAKRLLDRASTMERDGIVDAFEEDVDAKPGRCKRFFLGVLHFFGVKMRILLPLFQMLSKMGPTFKIPFPPAYVSMMAWVSALNLGIPDLMPLSCMGYRMNYWCRAWRGERK